MSIRKQRIDMTIRGNGMRKKIWKIWQTWLRISIVLNLIAFVLSACCLDSKSIVPTIIGFISSGWLLLIIIANTKGRKHGIKDREDYDFDI